MFNPDSLIPKVPKIDPSAISALRASINSYELGLADVMFDRLMAQIEDFESSLNKKEEICAYLSSFGSQILISIDHIGYHNPYLIIFSGVNIETKQNVRLVQHVSQLNVLFVVIRFEEDREPKRIGFSFEDNDSEVNNSKKEVAV